MRPDTEKLRAVHKFPVPETKKQVKTFLGLTGYYRKFIANYAVIAAPLSKIICRTEFSGQETVTNPSRS